MSIIKNCRVSAPKEIKFRSELGFKQHDIVLSKKIIDIKNNKIIFEWKKHCSSIVIWAIELIGIFLNKS